MIDITIHRNDDENNIVFECDTIAEAILQLEMVERSYERERRERLHLIEEF